MFLKLKLKLKLAKNKKQMTTENKKNVNNWELKWF